MTLSFPFPPNGRALWILLIVTSLVLRRTEQQLVADQTRDLAAASQPSAAGTVVNGLRLEVKVSPAAIVSGETITLSVDVVNAGDDPVSFYIPENPDMDGIRNWRLTRSDGRMFMPWWTSYQSVVSEGDGLDRVLRLSPGEKHRLMKAEVKLVQIARGEPRGFGWSQPRDAEGDASDFPFPIPPGDYELIFGFEKLDQLVPDYRPGRPHERPIAGLWTGKLKSGEARLRVTPRTKPFIQAHGPEHAKIGEAPFILTLENPTPQPLRLQGAFVLSYFLFPGTLAEARFQTNPQIIPLADKESFTLEVPAKGRMEFNIDAAALRWKLLKRFNFQTSKFEEMGGKIVSLAEVGGHGDCAVNFVVEKSQQSISSPPFRLGIRRAATTTRP